jgi:hypothetical protein
MIRKTTTWGIALLMFTLLLGACAPPAVDPTEEATDEPQVETEEPTEAPSETQEPTATRTPKPTSTPRPTSTPKPTETEEPTETESAATQSGATATKAPTSAATEGATDAPAELVPAGESVWVLDTTASETGSAPECPGPFYADFYGLVRIQTIDNGITWMRAQDGITYTLLRQSPNTYWGTGASIYPGYTLTISVVFASPTGFGATFVLIDQAIEGCNHYWKYGGTLR